MFLERLTQPDAVDLLFVESCNEIFPINVHLFKNLPTF